MPEFSASYTVAIDVTVYFEAEDEESAEDLASEVGEAVSLSLTDPPVSEINAINPWTKGVILDVQFDGPNGSELNDGPWDVDE